MGNANSGPKRKPNHLQLLRGTRKDRLNPYEPVPIGDVVKPTMSGVASAVWDRLAPICLQMGTLTRADVPAFVRLCELQATAELASAQKDAPQFAVFLVSEDYNGADKLQVHPALRLERETATALRMFYEYFGMTPGGRARIQVKPQEETTSKWAGILA